MHRDRHGDSIRANDPADSLGSGGRRNTIPVPCANREATLTYEAEHCGELGASRVLARRVVGEAPVELVAVELAVGILVQRADPRRHQV